MFQLNVVVLLKVVLMKFDNDQNRAAEHNQIFADKVLGIPQGIRLLCILFELII